ncbi:MAG: hypothetical protein ACREJM_14105, partial [Candidatus Saccharimonadales bacterium]
MIDDLEACCGKTLSPAQLAEATARLDEVARATGAAVLVIVRSAATTEGRVSARSLDRLTRAADVVWMAVADREPTDLRWLAPLKNNLGPLPSGKTFEVVEGRVEWVSAPVPEDALTPGSARSVERADRRSAGAWMIEALRDGDLPSSEFYQQAHDCGFSKSTVRRAADRIGLHSHKTSFSGGWAFSLSTLPENVRRTIEAGLSTNAGGGIEGAQGAPADHTFQPEIAEAVEDAQDDHAQDVLFPQTTGRQPPAASQPCVEGAQGAHAGQASQPGARSPRGVDAAERRSARSTDRAEPGVRASSGTGALTHS